MRPLGSPGMLEARRRKIVAFLKQKLSLHEIARRLGCHASSVLRWRKAYHSQGLAGRNGRTLAGVPPGWSMTIILRLSAN